MARATTTLTAASAALLALAACTPPGGNPEDLRRTRTGAATGGLLGGVAGALLADDGNRLAGAAIGAAAGGAVGAVVGNVMDKQAAELREAMDTRVVIINNGNELIVRMPQDLLFNVDSDTLRGDLQDDLRELADNLLRYPDTAVEVIGHTDSTGDAGYNQGLSERRANSVASVLRQNGVPGNRVIAQGRGEQQPVADNLTEAGRAQNRRVDITIRPI